LENVEGGEQGGGAVALVVVCHGRALAFLQRQPWLGAVEDLDLPLSSMETTTARAGWFI
jgi:hypothetical protein